LIDGLHEEVNLRMKKPYIENPESEDRQVMELGLEYHANSLRRDWSFFFFTFYGLSRSSINCITCNRESITFETFSSISLPLPEPAHTVISIIVHRLPNKVREQLGKKGD
jgi:ubiquitin C-terminal hydrolase